MVETLGIPNFSRNNIVGEYELAADVSPLQALASLITTADILQNDFLVTNPGSQTGEMLQVQSIAGQVVTMSSNFLLQHRNHERVVKLFGNQLKVYKAPNVDGSIPSDSAFLSLGTVFIDSNEPLSYYTDSAGGSDYWYKFTCSNSASGAETDISLSEPVRGGGYGHLVSISEIVNEAGAIDDRLLDESNISVRRDEAESEINGSLAAAGYTIPLQTATGVLFVPYMVTNIARLLSAGLIQIQNYGVTKPGSARDGSSKTKAARDMIAALQSRNIVLLDLTGQQLAKTDLVDGYPADDITATDVFFTMGKKF